MKLTLTIVRDDDDDKVMDALVAHGFYVTRLASTGGFLHIGNTVLLSAVEDDELDAVVEVIRGHTEVHIEPPKSQTSQESQASRAVVFAGTGSVTEAVRARERPAKSAQLTTMVRIL